MSWRCASIGIVLLLVTGTVSVLANELDSMRLFFPAQTSVESESKIKDIEPPSGDIDSKKKRLPKAPISFKYNGFVSSQNGRAFFINGKRIDDQADLSMISASIDGRQISIQIPNGQVLKIAIGHSVELVRP